MNEELDDILARPPGVLLQWGIAVLFGIMVMALTGVWFIQYPEIIKGSVTIETAQSQMRVSTSAGDSLPNKQFAGKATFPVTYIGKLQVGQKVSIRLDAFPYQEYGVWQGVVKKITPATNSSQCLAIIIFTDGIRFTQLIQKLPFRPTLTGDVDLIVKDVRLIERLVDGLMNS